MKKIKKKETHNESRIRTLKRKRREKLKVHDSLRERKIRELKANYHARIKEACEIFGVSPEELVRQRLALNEQDSVDRELREWDAQQTSIPTGKYKDTERTSAVYQQQFVQFLRKLCPEVIEELKSFTSIFKDLFTQKTDKYYGVFDGLQYSLVDSTSYIRNYLLNCEYRSFKRDFYWSEHKYLLILLQSDLCLKVPAYANEVTEPFKALLNSHPYLADSAQRILSEAFKTTANTDTDYVFSSVRLLLGLINWAEKYGLNKDWLINYGIYFIAQFSFDSIVNIDDLKIEPLDAYSLGSPDFDFKARGWRPGIEEKEEYEIAVTDYFLEELEKYFSYTFRNLRLDKRKSVTKPIKFDSVAWLVQWTVQQKSYSEILQEITDSDDSGEGIEEDTLKKAFETFENFDLPIRN